MNEEELFRLAISDVSTYSLLNEILAIRDNRFPNEEVDYCINVNGYISLDALNKYVKVVQENHQLKEKNDKIKIAIAENCDLRLDYELYKDNHIYKNYEVEMKENTIKKLKEAVKEVRTYIKYYLLDNSWFKDSQKEFEKLLQMLETSKEDNIMNNEKLNGVSCPGVQGAEGIPGKTFEGRLLIEYTELVERIVLLEKALGPDGKIEHIEPVLEKQLSIMRDYRDILQLRIIALLLKDKKEN